MFQKKLISIFLIVALFVFMCGCEEENYYDNEDHDAYINSTVLKKVVLEEEKSIVLGTKNQLEYILVPNGGVVQSLIFESSDESVVSVDNLGNITALKLGSAVIKATFNETIVCECTVTVTELPDAVFANDIPSKAYKNDSFEMTVNLHNFDCGMIKLVSSGISGKVVSEGNEVIFNDQNSEIYVVGDEFTVDFTVTSDKNSLISVFCYDNGMISDVFVKDIEILSDKLSVFPAEVVLNVGDEIMLSAEETAGVSWLSSDSDVASVNSGKVIAKKTGSTVITVSNGKASGTITVNVVEKNIENEQSTQG